MDMISFHLFYEEDIELKIFFLWVLFKPFVNKIDVLT